MRQGCEYEVYSNIKPNPTIENVQTGVAAFKESGADYLIAWRRIVYGYFQGCRNHHCKSGI